MHGEVTLATEGHTASKWRIRSFPYKVAAIFRVTALSHYIAQILITAIRSVLSLSFFFFFLGGGRAVEVQKLETQRKCSHLSLLKFTPVCLV